MSITRYLVLAALIGAGCLSVWPQGQLKRTSIKTDKLELGAGGTLSIAGAPVGSIKIVGSNRNDVEITAEIELTGATEADLDALTQVTGFVASERLGRVLIITIGTHNKLGSKEAWKKFPKRLINQPFRVDYTLAVPRYSNLEIDGGSGALEVMGVEGIMRVNFLDTRAKIEVINGSINGTFGGGTVEVAFGTRGWRSRPTNLQMNRGDLIVRLPSTASAEIDALLMGKGTIENELGQQLKPRDPKVLFTERAVIATAGVGGALMKLTVGEGNLKLARLTAPF